MHFVLTTLKDIDRVLGSFVLDVDGGLLARDMPGVFDDETLRAAGARLVRLRSALSTDKEPFEQCCARFGENLLLLRAAGARTLCVLAPREANLTALHMGATLVARRVASMDPEVHPAAPHPIVETRSVDIPVSVEPVLKRRFRGQPVS